MALIRFNPKTFTADVLVGLEETFIPTPETIQVSKKLESIRVKMSTFLFDNFHTDNTLELMKLFNKDEESLKKWTDFINNVLPPLVTDVTDNIIKVNETICSNYAELKKV